MTERLDRIRAAMADEGLDALWISSPVDDVFGKHSMNRRYVSGFTGSAGHALITRYDAFLAVDSRYVEQAEREAEARGFRIFPYKDRWTSWVPRFVREAGLPGKNIGVSQADMSLGGFERLREAIDGLPWAIRPRIGPASRIVEQLRHQKDAEEIALLKRAIEVADEAYERVEAAMQPGQTEQEIALAVERAVRDLGADGVSFDTIVAGGPWAAMPHASPRPEPIAAGGMLFIDMGAQCPGYCSDLTRTTFVGDADVRFREIYEIVFDAQRAAIEGVEAGMPGSAAHELAHAVIRARGYGNTFGHGLGHGVGLEVHEAPYLGPSSEDTLEEGMVFTIEPGIYIPGWGGVRIEDVVMLENGKARVLSHARKLTPGGARP